MNRLREHLVRAGADLGIRVVAPFELFLGPDIRLSAEALFPELGAAKGMIVVRSYDDLEGAADKLVKEGYGYSVLGKYLPNEDYDVESYREMFSDWGWASGDERRPDWME